MSTTPEPTSMVLPLLSLSPMAKQEIFPLAVPATTRPFPMDTHEATAPSGKVCWTTLSSSLYTTNCLSFPAVTVRTSLESMQEIPLFVDLCQALTSKNEVFPRVSGDGASAAAALSVGLRTLFNWAQTSDICATSSSGRSFSRICMSDSFRRLAEGASSSVVVASLVEAAAAFELAALAFHCSSCCLTVSRS